MRPEERAEIKGILDIGYLYPNEEKIMKFLKKIYEIPLEKPKEWEKEIFDFFRENPVVVYVIERRVDADYEVLNILKQFVSGFCRRIVILDTGEIYKDLCQIYESAKLNRNVLKKHYEFFIKLSVFIRKMMGKVIDKEDSSFNHYSSKIIPMEYECTFTKTGNKFYENIYFICADGSLDYNLEEATRKIRSEFDKNLKAKLGKKQNKGKQRNPIESRLRHEVFKRDKYRCVECGKTNKETSLHADHIVPVSQGGTDELDNLQTLCQACNLAKSNKAFKGCKQ